MHTEWMAFGKLDSHVKAQDESKIKDMLDLVSHVKHNKKLIKR